MTLSPSDIKVVVDSLRASNWDDAVVTVGETQIAVSRNGTVSALPQPNGVEAAHAAAPSAPLGGAAAFEAGVPAADAVVPPPSGEQTIFSPSVGIFRRAPGPSAAPFIEVGQVVKAGDTLGVLEVLKRMSNISADVDGVITALHVEDAGAVEFGSPLVSIRAGV